MRIFKMMSPFFLFLLFLTPFRGFSEDFEGVRELAKRRVEWLSDHMILQKIPKQDSDRFILSTEKGKLIIKATSASSAAFGLNWYLKYYCHRSMSHMGDNLSPLTVIPTIKEPVVIDASAKYRYALNYCTYNYTMSFYTWADWEHELDWMALNGVNVMLVANGTEAVWQNVLRQLGYSQKEIDRYITGPAYYTWWLMGNIQGWGGPMPQTQIEDRKLLTQNMLRRMKGLGMEPVLPAFYGMVPSDLKHKINAKIITQGSWGAFTRPDILVPGDPFFDKIADLFYQETKKLYGKDIRFFSGDPFHEGGITGDIDLGDAGLSIQKAMQRNFPGAVWVLQGWQANPRREMLSKVDKSSILIQELFGENTQNWEDRKGYEQTPFIWCTVTNFGERPGINGKLQRFADEVYRARNSVYGSYLKGVGIMPEGINNNPVVYELLMELGWHKDHVNINDWIKTYIAARYGKTTPAIEDAWQSFLTTVYNSDSGYQEGPPENILCARPALQIKSVSTWGNIRKKFDVIKYKAAVKVFLEALPEFETSETYLIDAINFVKQDIANDADTVFNKLVNAYEQRNTALFEKEAARFLQLIDQTDMLLNSNSYYKFSTYLTQAKASGKTFTEKQNNFLNALMLVTYWGGNDPKEDNLHEYAYKEWGGLMTSYYKPRWELYFEELRKQLNGKKSEPVDFFHWERDWVKERYASGITDREEKNYNLKQVLDIIY